MVGWVYNCTSVQEHCTVLAGLRDKEAARGRPADWSETSAGGERIERHCQIEGSDRVRAKKNSFYSK